MSARRGMSGPSHCSPARQGRRPRHRTLRRWVRPVLLRLVLLKDGSAHLHLSRWNAGRGRNGLWPLPRSRLLSQVLPSVPTSRRRGSRRGLGRRIRVAFKVSVPATLRPTALYQLAVSRDPQQQHPRVRHADRVEVRSDGPLWQQAQDHVRVQAGPQPLQRLLGAGAHQSYHSGATARGLFAQSLGPLT
jgi:hypothetical protein